MWPEWKFQEKVRVERPGCGEWQGLGRLGFVDQDEEGDFTLKVTGSP